MPGDMIGERWKKAAKNVLSKSQKSSCPCDIIKPRDQEDFSMWLPHHSEGLKKGDIFAPDNPLERPIGQLLSPTQNHLKWNFMQLTKKRQMSYMIDFELS